MPLRAPPLSLRQELLTLLVKQQFRAASSGETAERGHDEQLRLSQLQVWCAAVVLGIGPARRRRTLAPPVKPGLRQAHNRSDAGISVAFAATQSLAALHAELNEGKPVLAGVQGLRHGERLYATRVPFQQKGDKVHDIMPTNGRRIFGTGWLSEERCEVPLQQPLLLWNQGTTLHQAGQGRDRQGVEAISERHCPHHEEAQAALRRSVACKWNGVDACEDEPWQALSQLYNEGSDIERRHVPRRGHCGHGYAAG
mmetsp:Transcript_26644/g.58546  ORF Transcript_26644/g.58546 Transcript_26644/m.58546 type:complete len:254 (+) Transcript_26644:1265-2026(+)